VGELARRELGGVNLLDEQVARGAERLRSMPISFGAVDEQPSSSSKMNRAAFSPR
jgi:hypothetical protein